jgi:hypothetical protein
VRKRVCRPLGAGVVGNGIRKGHVRLQWESILKT